MDKDYLPVAELAKALGVSQAYISRKKKEGRIVGELRCRRFFADVDESLARLGKSRADLKGPYAPATTASPAPAQEAEQATSAASVQDSYYAERSRHESIKRQHAELKLAAARGELISAADVAAWCGRIGVTIRERVMSIESTALTEMDAKAHVWLVAEIRAVLNRTADELERETARLLRGRDIGEQEVDDAADAS